MSLQDRYLEACRSLGCCRNDFVCQQLQSTDFTRGHLYLPGNCKELFIKRITDVQAVALVQVLREHPVTSLNLAYNELGDTAAKAVAQLLTASNLESADELAVHAGLRELNLSSNRITAQGAIVIAEALAQPQCRLQSLVLSRNTLGDSGITALAVALQTNSSLQHLDISSTDVAEKGVICLAASLAEYNSSISSLNISSPLLQQRPQQDTITHLTRMLACNSSMQVFQMARAGLTDAALELLVRDGLLRNSSITQLNLSANKLSPLAGNPLQLLLSSSRGQSIAFLDLSYNRLQDDGAKLLAAAMPNCKALSQLYCNNCSIGDSGLEAVLDAISKAPVLTAVRLWGNTFGVAASQKLWELHQQKHRQQLVEDVVVRLADGMPCVAAAN